MQTVQHEQSGLPDDEEIPLLGDFMHSEDKQTRLERAINCILKEFKKVNLPKLGSIGFSKKGNRSDIVQFGPRGGETKLFKADGSFLKNFMDKNASALEPRSEDIDRDTAQVKLDKDWRTLKTS